MGTTKTSSWRSTPRARAGGGLAALGAILITMAMIIAFTAVPARVAFAHGGFPHGDQNCDPLGAESADAGWKIQINSNDDPPTGSTIEADGVESGDVTWSITETNQHTIVYSWPGGDAYYLNYNYTGSGYTLYGIFIKAPGQDTTVFTSTNPGSIEIPDTTSHIILCFQTDTTTTTTTTTSTSTTTTTVPDTTTTTSTSTTTTTVPDTTTTTVGGPTTTTTSTSTTTTTVADTTTTTVGGPSTTTTTVGETTTTTVGQTTTTVAGPCDPGDEDCLPNTGGTGNMIAVLLAGIGLLLLGSGLIVLADERRRMMVA